MRILVIKKDERKLPLLLGRGDGLIKPLGRKEKAPWLARPIVAHTGSARVAETQGPCCNLGYAQSGRTPLRTLGIQPSLHVGRHLLLLLPINEELAEANK